MVAWHLFQSYAHAQLCCRIKQWLCLESSAWLGPFAHGVIREWSRALSSPGTDQRLAEALRNVCTVSPCHSAACKAAHKTFHNDTNHPSLCNASVGFPEINFHIASWLSFMRHELSYQVSRPMGLTLWRPMRRTSLLSLLAHHWNQRLSAAAEKHLGRSWLAQLHPRPQWIITQERKVVDQAFKKLTKKQRSYRPKAQMNKLIRGHIQAYKCALTPLLGLMIEHADICTHTTVHNVGVRHCPKVEESNAINTWAWKSPVTMNSPTCCA